MYAGVCTYRKFENATPTPLLEEFRVCKEKHGKMSKKKGDKKNHNRRSEVNARKGGDRDEILLNQ
jgi:hypothetical protein